MSSQVLQNLMQDVLELDIADQLISNIKNQEQTRIGGLSGNASGLLIAALHHKLDRPLLLLTSGEQGATKLNRELSTLYNLNTIQVPPWETTEQEQTPSRNQSSRLTKLMNLYGSSMNAGVIICSLLSLMQQIPPPDQVQKRERELTSGDQLQRESFIESLVENGYRRVDRVRVPGEFAARGGILDLFPEQTRHPLRFEFFGDRIDSIRTFNPDNQNSKTRRDATRFTLVNRNVLNEYKKIKPGPSLLNILNEHPLPIWYEPERIYRKAERIKRYHDGNEAHERFTELSMHPIFDVKVDVSSIHISEEEEGINVSCGTVSSLGKTQEQMQTNLETLSEEVSRILVVCPADGEQQRMQEVLKETDLTEDSSTSYWTVNGSLSGGFLWPDLDLAVTGREHADHATETEQQPSLPTSSAGSRPIDDFLELDVGDYVVHVDHGIARYGGVKTKEKDGIEHDVMKLFFKNSVLLEVPETEVHLVQKYLGAGRGTPSLSKIGGSRWEKKKQNVSEAIREMGKELIQLQALREQGVGHSCKPDTDWQAEFEEAFPHRETPDQERINGMIKKKMESTKPMDLLLTGDVGFGKTELAMRAAFKMVMEGKQVAMMTPTTVLTQQHVRTFRERMGTYPIRIKPLSRFQTGSEQNNIISSLDDGTTDIVIGTHRLLSDDVSFDDLGLLIIDEEQRFGVQHKEKLKQLRASVDILTMTATPIPRSLHMALLGIRDIATLRTPPEGRRNIRTNVVPYKKKTIREALRRELERDGQIYYLHNRVQTIDTVKEKVQDLVPDATVRIAHGQLNKKKLKRVMNRFYDGAVDVLVCTTIIESGLDHKNVNTIIIENADRFGLADLHQLRGRIGRHNRRGHAYFLLPQNRPITPVARRRLEAIESHSELGAGFKVAMRDLEIRGAGRILGKEQSGHINSVGYDLYCKLLEREMKKLKNEDHTPEVDTSIQSSINVRIPEDFAGSKSNRIRIYRRFGQCDTEEELNELMENLADQYGEQQPDPVQNLELHTRLRLRASRLGIISISEGNGLFILRFRNQETIQPLLNHHPDRIRQTGEDKLYVYHSDEDQPVREQMQNLLELMKFEDARQPIMS